MKLPEATKKLERRQSHLLRRIGASKKPLTHDVDESAAISCVLMEIKRLTEENQNLKGK